MKHVLLGERKLEQFEYYVPLWFEFCTLVGCFRIISLVMHALIGKHTPYALNDDDDELDDNDSDDVFDDENDGNNDDHDHRRHLCHCHHDYHNSHHHRHNHHPCHHHHHCP